MDLSIKLIGSALASFVLAWVVYRAGWPKASGWLIILTFALVFAGIWVA